MQKIEEYINDCISTGKAVLSTEILLPPWCIIEIENILMTDNDSVARKKIKKLLTTYAEEQKTPFEKLFNSEVKHPVQFLTGKTRIGMFAMKRHLDNGGKIMFLDSEGPGHIEENIKNLSESQDD